jgi:hypothetical protein
MRFWKSIYKISDEEGWQMLKEIERIAMPLWPERPLTFLERFFLALLVVVPIIAFVAFLVRW